MTYFNFLRSVIDFSAWPVGYPYVAMDSRGIHFFKEKPRLRGECIRETRHSQEFEYWWSGDKSSFYQESSVDHPKKLVYAYTKEDLEGIDLAYAKKQYSEYLQELDKQKRKDWIITGCFIFLVIFIGAALIIASAVTP